MSRRAVRATQRGMAERHGALGEAGTAAAKTDTSPGARYRRLVKRRGHIEVLVAVARSILVIVWHLINDPANSPNRVAAEERLVLYFTVKLDCENWSDTPVTTRDDQRSTTRARLLDVAVESLVESGFASTTTVSVQRRAGVSRGTLLHHFPTREALFAAAVERLVQVNLQAMREELAAAPSDCDPVTRGMRVLRRSSRRPSFGAELELWSAARTDARLRAALRSAEQSARSELYSMIDEVFGPQIVGSPRYRLVVDLTVQLVRGLAVTASLYERADRDEPLIGQWADLIRALLRDELPAGSSGAAADVP
jgi:AcrR family transcriptional regulator